MKLLKHILIVVALMVAATPCCHAADHVQHDHGGDVAAEICASHACACHSCAETSCTEELEMPQDLAASTTPAVAPSSVVQLHIFTEPKPVSRRIPQLVAGILASIQTVQLLI